MENIDDACPEFEKANVFLTFKQIVDLYWAFVESEKKKGNETEGASVFKPGELEQAIDRARYGDIIEPDVFDSVSYLMEGIVRGHAFGNLNKRFSIVLAFTFLDLNGWTFTVSCTCDIVNFTIELAEGFKTRCDIKEMLVQNSKKKHGKV